VQRILVESVLGLEKMYRTAVLLRFYDDLPPRAIARRLNIPVATVRTRVQRATEMLRRDLARRYGKRERWLPGLVALGWRPYVRDFRCQGLGRGDRRARRHTARGSIRPAAEERAITASQT
jgi:hypothetical protein